MEPVAFRAYCASGKVGGTRNEGREQTLGAHHASVAAERGGGADGGAAVRGIGGAAPRGASAQGGVTESKQRTGFPVRCFREKNEISSLRHLDRKFDP